MSRVRSVFPGHQRSVALLVALGVAVLLALALVVEPRVATRERSDSAGRSTQAVAPDVGGADAARAGDAGGAPQVAMEARDAITSTGGGAAAGGVAAPSAAVEGALAPPTLDARIIRTGSIELRIRRGGFEDAWGDAQAVAGAFGGYVVAASRSGASEGPRRGSITLRIPSGRFDAAVERVRDVSGAKVERLDVASQDVTQEFVDVRSRLRHDRAVEARLLSLLARTGTVSEVLAVQARLDQVQEQIEVSRGRIEFLERMTSFSTIELALREPGAASTPADDGDSVLGAAWHDARDRFAENVAGAIVWAGGALPALVVLGVVALAGRWAWRRSGRGRRVPAAE